jgi:hypothetical protein
VPLEMKKGTIPVRGTKGLSTRPRCITLITQFKVTDTHTHTLRICNTNCFSTATIVARTRLNTALYVNCLSCCFCIRLLIFMVWHLRQSAWDRSSSFYARRVSSSKDRSTLF